MDTPKTIEIVLTALIVGSAFAYLAHYTYKVFAASKCQSSGCNSCKAKLEETKGSSVAKA